MEEKLNSLQIEIIKKIKDKLELLDLEQLTPYISNRTKITIKSKITGEIWDVLPDTIIHGMLIPPSERRRRAAERARQVTDRNAKGVEYFKNMISIVHGEKYSYIDKYVNLETPCDIWCNKCKKIFSSKPKYIIKGHGCQECGKAKSKSKKANHESFVKKVEKLTNGEYTVLGKYSGNYNKILMRHNKCGKKYLVTPKYFLRGDRCSSCIDTKIMHTYEKFKKYISTVEPSYEIVSEFKGRKKPIVLRNNRFNEVYETTPDKFIAGVRSPSESTSKGETLIRGILNEKGIKFRAHYKEKSLVDRRPLEFDFKITINNIVHFIEFNGIQHYLPVEIFGGEKYLKRVQKHDKMKLNFCNENNIPFLVIPYNWNSEKIHNEINNFLNIVGAYKPL